MEFKIGDKVKMHPDSAYIAQGIEDGQYITGLVISEEEYGRIASIPDFKAVFVVYVRWEKTENDFCPVLNVYQTKDLILSVQENRDKLLNEILDGI
jgi:hypothetical protein